MKISEAIELVREGVLPQDSPEAWADLGCGSGVFTSALASLLPAGSTIYAVDKKRQSIPPAVDKQVSIVFQQTDFEKEALALPILQGILMANSLHYVADKKRLLVRLREKIDQEGRMIIIEYDSLRANPWVPYPIDFSGIKQLFREVGFTPAIKLGERPSRYRRGNIYAAYAELKKQSM